jgi:hypothetical protein
MFKRGGPPAQSSVDAERQALFEKLAQRPETVCPFLGLAAARADYEAQATDEHRCFAFGAPEPVSGEQQRNVCLQRGYANCPRYLRGVLVIPTDELEALRRPPQKVPPPPPPKPPAPAEEGGGRRRGLIVLLLLLLLIGGGAGAWYLVAGPGAVADNPTPTPPEPSPSVAASSAPSLSEEPSAAPTESLAPTPEPGDEFIGYEVLVSPGPYDIFRIDDAGTVTAQNRAFFDAVSQAPVDRVVAANGLLHWRVTQGDVSIVGFSYVRDDSGPFQIREVYRGSDGSLRYVLLPEDEI